MANFLHYLTFLLQFLLIVPNISGKATLVADGITETYSLINSIFGEGSSALELPDCNHTQFGPHITQTFDPILNSSVFAFHLHIKQDDDRCQKFDRQRNEIKTNESRNVSQPVEDQLIGRLQDRMTLSWNFKLDADFLAPYSFCHIHQLKAVGGDDSMPLITLTPRKSTPNELQLLQYDSKGALHFLSSVPLQSFLGVWIHAQADVVFGHGGSYGLSLTRWRDGWPLMNYTTGDIDLWRNDTGTAVSFVRPKWGLYRSLHEAVLSRDETVLFSDICVGVGDEDLCV